jgi:uncharacterized protein
MLFRLELENFYSIRDLQVIDLLLAENVPIIPERFAPIHKGSQERVPKVVAIFGPNASGKSMALRGLAFLAWFVQHSFLQLPAASDTPPPGIGFQPCERFYSRDTAGRLTRLCAHFTGALNYWDPPEERKQFCRYAYEVSFRSEVAGAGFIPKPRTVVHESVRQWPEPGSKPIRVFARNEKGEVTASREFGLKGYQKVIEKVRSNASVISTLVQFDHAPALLMRDLARTVLPNILIEKIEPTDIDVIRTFYGPNPPLQNALKRELDRIDLGIRDMRIVPGTQLAQFDHYGLTDPLPIQLESHGTRNFIRIFPALMQALDFGGIAIVDDLDVGIHPSILPEIVRWFHDPERNPNDAQLWMSCQAASLLENLEKEEVFFCEKNREGRTKIYGLRDVQAVRRTDNFYRKYLGGVYGAVPKVG